MNLSPAFKIKLDHTIWTVLRWVTVDDGLIRNFAYRKNRNKKTYKGTYWNNRHRVPPRDGKIGMNVAIWTE